MTRSEHLELEEQFHNLTREEKVATFNRLMDQAIANDPFNIPLKLRQLGITLTFDELVETALAADTCDTLKKRCQSIIDRLDQKEGTKPLTCEDRVFTSETPDGDEVNHKELLDGLNDVQYTNSWCVNVFGFSKVFDASFDDTCISNDSKACATMEEAIATKEYWENPANREGGGEHIIFPVGHQYVVKNKGGKVRKSINYKSVDHTKYIEQLANEKSQK